MIFTIELLITVTFILSNAIPGLAQQFKGAIITNSLPVVPGSEITFWNIFDVKGANTTLINYSSLTAAGTRLTASNIKRVIIFVHGLQRDAGNYMSNMLSALSQVQNASDVNFSSVQIVCPYFANGDDKNYGYPWNTSAPAGGSGSFTSALVWPGSQWIGGALNQYPYKQKTISNYAVLDQMIQYYDNKKLYPNVKQIVVAGHSAGAQSVQRYAEVGNILNISTPLSYWVANPNSYGWMSTSRPLDHSNCPTYDNWPDGFNNYTSQYTYASDLVAQGRSAILARYNSRKLAYSRGLLDLGDDSSSCGPFSEGANRNERFLELIKAFPATCLSFTTCSTVDYVNVAHDAAAMMVSASGMARLFLDNFNGTQTMAYDVGCPRQMAGDDPYPDPACGGTIAESPDTFLSYNNMSYQGCYTDGSSRSLSYTAYINNNNTIQMCTAACAAASYIIAGMEYANECYCGNTVAYTAQGPLLDSDCSMPCAGNSSQICGGPSHLSVFSTTVPSVDIAPMSPAVVGSFYYRGCYTEASSGRALALKSSINSAMTIEQCAAFCVGSNSFGVEYSTECYCGNALSAGSILTANTECGMTCGGNGSELCGGPNRLNLYMMNGTVLSATSTSVISSSMSSVTTTVLSTNSLTTTTTTTTGSSTSPATTSITTLSCPASNATYFMTSGQTFLVECYLDRAGGDAGMVYTNSLDACLTACAALNGCTNVAWVPGSPGPCYMKTSVVSGSTNIGVWGGLVAAPMSLSLTSSSIRSSISSTISADSGNTSGGSSSNAIISPPGSGISTTTSVNFTSSSLPFSTSTSSLASSTMSSSGTTASLTSMTFSTSTTSLNLVSSSLFITTMTSTVTTRSSSSTTASLPSGFTPIGCYVDSGSRTLPTQIYSNSSNTPALCALVCRDAGYKYSGTEYSSECYCGASGPTMSTVNSDCNMPCSGDSTQICGAGWRLNIVQDLAWQPTLFVNQGTDIWSLQACYIDGSPRTLSVAISNPNGGGANMTIVNCLNACQMAGYAWCGAEYSSECWASNTAPNGNLVADPVADPITGGCNMPCKGNASEVCGGSNRIVVYGQ